MIAMGESDYYIGVDVGGTKILATVVTPEGEIATSSKHSTLHDGTPLADQISDAIDELCDDVSRSGARGIGVAVPGIVESATGRFVNAPNIDIDDSQVVQQIQDRYDLPVAIGNDVNLGTFAECWLGVARDADTVIGMFVGTGIGGGVVIDGRLRTGPEDLAGEIGHMIMEVDGPLCGCGNYGCLEALASKTAIHRDIQEALDEGRSTVVELPENRVIKSGRIEDAIDAGDEVVTEILITACRYIGLAVVSLRHILNPDMVVFGGGLVESCEDFMLPLIEKEVAADCHTGSADTLTLAVSKLGDDAVALGAAALVRAQISGLSLREWADRLDQ
ncbi:MAG: ROK family protein [Armatimonadota bacterium]